MSEAKYIKTINEAKLQGQISGMMGLAKMKSKRGMQIVIEKRIIPSLYWEGKALEEFFK